MCQKDVARSRRNFRPVQSLPYTPGRSCKSSHSARTIPIITMLAVVSAAERGDDQTASCMNPVRGDGRKRSRYGSKMGKSFVAGKVGFSLSSAAS